MKKQFALLIISIFLLVMSCTSKSTIENGNYYEKIDGIYLNYSIKGHGPVMLVGHPTAGKIGYELTLKPLEENFTMIYYDPRGTGKSQAPRKLEEYNADHLTKEIDLLRKKLNLEKIWLFGHSDQSAVALQYAVEHPQNVTGLMLTGTSFIGDIDETIKRRKESEMKRKSESEWFSQVVKDLEYRYQNNSNKDQNGRNLSDATVKWWAYNEASSQKVIPISKLITQTGRRKPINGKVYIENSYERQKYLEIQQKFKYLTTKTLIINGEFDTNNPPKFAKELQKRIPNSKLVLMDKSGHIPWIEQQSETFSEINKWLFEQ